MIETKLHIATPDGATYGHLFQPEETGSWPGVLHYPDLIGIRPAALDMARRVAALGYSVLVPNLLYRYGEPPFFPAPITAFTEEVMAKFREMMMSTPPPAQERDVGRYVDTLLSQPGVRGTRIAVVGHCFSGAVALRTAAVRPDDVAAAASFHGGGLWTTSADSPHLVLPRVNARLYLGHADQDPVMPAEAISALESALEDWGGRFENETYEGAVHGWTVPDSRAYDPPQAERAFGKLQALLDETLR